MSNKSKKHKKMYFFLKKTLQKKQNNIIIHLSFYEKDGRLKEYRMENLDSLEFKKEIASSEASCFGNVFPWENKTKKGVHMTNILDAAKFIIQLYYKTGEKYHCSRTKVEKLLSIANLIAFKNNTKLFEEEIWVNRCGVGIPVLSVFFFSDIVAGKVEEESKHIELSEINENVQIPTMYNLYSTIGFTERELLTNVFLRFGAYDALIIGQAFDEFKGEICVENKSNQEHPIVNFERSYDFFNDLLMKPKMRKNELIDYIINYLF